MKDFFISYNKADRQWAEWIGWALEEAGYSTVIQAWDFKPGENFVLEMNKATQEAQCIIAVLSPDYLEAHYTPSEWAAAFAQDPKGVKRTLIPVRIRECGLSGLLSQIIYIDLVGLDEVSARERLLQHVSGERGKPSEPPPFPGTAERSVLKQPHFPGGSAWNVSHARFRFTQQRRTDIRRLLVWLQGNKQWVFSGIGVALLMLILGWVFSGSESGPDTVTANGGVAAGRDIEGSKIIISNPMRPDRNNAKSKENE